MPVVNPRPDAFQVMDFGAAMRAGQDIQRNRMRNEAEGLSLEETRRQLENRKKAADIRSHFDKMPEQIDALDKAGLFEQADKLRETYIQARKSEVELIDAMRDGITKDNYEDLRQQMIRSGAITPELWPANYSESWWREKAKDQRSTLTKLTRKWAQGGSILSQDLVTRDGEIVWSGTPYDEYADPNEGGGGKPRKITTADENALARWAERMHGGLHDPATGELTALDPTKAPKVQALQARAMRYYTSGAADSLSDAMSRASRDFGIVVEDPADQSTYNPLGLPGRGRPGSGYEGDTPGNVMRRR